MKPLIREFDVRKPYMTTLYAIGDIHGDIEQLEMIHARIKDDIAANRIGNHQIIHIGDLVDRQFQSKRVIDYLITGHESGEPWVTLKGNHDRMMVLFIDHKKQDPKLRSALTWLHPRLGGLTTLESYGITGLSHQQEDEIQIEAWPKSPLATAISCAAYLPTMTRHPYSSRMLGSTQPLH